jgi:hypothetical protein
MSLKRRLSRNRAVELFGPDYAEHRLLPRVTNSVYKFYGFMHRIQLTVVLREAKGPLYVLRTLPMTAPLTRPFAPGRQVYVGPDLEEAWKVIRFFVPSAEFPRGLNEAFKRKLEWWRVKPLK